MKKKFDTINLDRLRTLCPSFGTKDAERCPYFFPFKEVIYYTEEGNRDFTKDTFTYKKGMEGKECLLGTSVGMR